MKKTVRSLLFVLIQFGFLSNGSAQLISIKTVPVATGNQFLLFPAANAGMGDVSIAVDDLLHDPFVNPAKGMCIRKIHFYSSPMYYRITGDNGTGKTLPLGVFLPSNKWFGNLSVSLQQLALDYFSELRSFMSVNQNNFFEDNSVTNIYVFGSLGYQFVEKKTSIAGSVFWSDLNAMEGVDLLYGSNNKLDQNGKLLDVRLGLLKKFADDRSFEALVLYNRLRMTHDLYYSTWYYDNEGGEFRFNRNYDYSDTWGVHFGYVQPLPDSDWRIGGILTGNWKTHPKIPNYELMNIPRDPGNSLAYDVGIGFSQKSEKVVFGIDIIYEPIRSNTWANAAEPTPTKSGGLVPNGWKTVDNQFRFSNSIFRIGFKDEEKPPYFQLGLQVKSINYWMDQTNFVEEIKRQQHENWVEWSIDYGMRFKLAELQLIYMGEFIFGTGRPGVEITRRAKDAISFSDFMIAPGGKLALKDEVVFTQRISIVLPI